MPKGIRRSVIGKKKDSERLGELTLVAKTFIAELVASPTWDIKAAALAAGYKDSSTGYKLLRDARVQEAISRALKQREKRCELRQDDVLEYLRFVLFFNPLKYLSYFKPTRDGTWAVSRVEELPDEVGRIIDKFKYKSIQREDETIELIEVEFISKTVALTLALKHLGISNDKIKLEIERQTDVRIDWDELCRDTISQENEVERRILEVQALPHYPSS